MFKKICNIVTSLMLVALVAIAVVLVVPSILGYQSYVVLSGSMEPTYHVGSLIFVKPVQPEEIQEGDAITFRLGGQTTSVATHRVKSIDTEQRLFITQGDNNKFEDLAPISFDQLVGRAADFNVPVAGRISLFIKTTYGMITAVGFVLIMVLLMFLPEWLFPKKEKEMTEAKKEPDDAQAKTE